MRKARISRNTCSTIVSPRDAGAAHHLDAAIGDAEQRLGDRDLGHRAFRRAERAGVEHVGAPVDHQLGLLQVDQIVGQHEADALMVDQQLAERLALAGIVGGDLLRAGRGAEPAHAVRQPRRAEAHLRILEALARSRRASGRPARADCRSSRRRGRPASSCRSCRARARCGSRDRAGRPGTWQAPSADFAMTMPTLAPVGAGDEGLAAVDHPVVAVLHGGRSASSTGSEPAPPSSAGSVMKKAERAAALRPAASRKRSFCSGAADLAEQVHVALVGRRRVAPRAGRAATGPIFFSTCAVSRWVRCAAVGQDVRRQHAGRARLRRASRRPVRRSARGSSRRGSLLVGDDVADEGLDPVGDLVRAGGWMGHGSLLCLLSELVGKDAGLIQPSADGRAASGRAWDYRMGAMADQRFSGTCGAGSAFAPGYDETPAPESFGA